MRRRLATLAATGVALALLAPAASASAASDIHVLPGESIQAAIDAAPAGAVIHVAGGTYPGSLEIGKSLHLVGDHAIIVPAATDPYCIADWAFAGKVGICVHGALDFDTFQVTPISTVSLEGLTVQGFGGPGVVVFAVDGFRGDGLVTAHSGEMGMFVNMVSGVSLRHSRSHDNHGDGFFFENLPEGSAAGDALISGNTAHGNLGSGIIFINSNGGRIAHNDLRGNCAGIVVVAFAGQYGSNSGDVSIDHNRAVANNRWCPPDGSGAPAYGGIGIGLFGAHGTSVARNVVRDNHAQAGSAYPGGGIVIATVGSSGDDPASPAPTGNAVRFNRLNGNTTYDIFSDGSGTGNTVSGNTCRATNAGGC